MKLDYSFIIPVYNRPQEINELLESFTLLQFNERFEIIIVEDGSSETSQSIVKEYSEKLNISYYYKENSGPGDSRNFGMQKAKGNYFIIFGFRLPVISSLFTYRRSFFEGKIL